MKPLSNNIAKQQADQALNQSSVMQKKIFSSQGRLLDPRSLLGFVGTSTVPLLASPTHHTPTVGQDDRLVKTFPDIYTLWQNIRGHFLILAAPKSGSPTHLLFKSSVYCFPLTYIHSRTE